MLINLSLNKIKPLFEEEVSRIALDSRNEKGQSLYDIMIYYIRDNNEVERQIKDGIAIFFNQLGADDLCIKRGDSNYDMYLPDFAKENEEYAIGILVRYVSLNAVSTWLGEKAHPLTQLFLERTKSALLQAVTIFTTRKRPRRYESRN